MSSAPNPPRPPAASPATSPGASPAGPPRLRRSIRAKLGIVIASAVAAAVTVSLILGLWWEAGRWARTRQETLYAAAQVIAAAAAKAVAAEDPARVEEALRAIGRIPGLLYAEAANLAGQPIAEMGGAVRLVRDPMLKQGGAASPLTLLRSGTVEVTVPVLNAGVTVGRIRLVSDTRDLLARFGEVIAAVLAGGFIALTVGLGVSLRLQRSITRPLLALTASMAAVRERHDYAVRIDIRNDDEIGVLAEAFNRMIAEISGREREIVTRLVRAAEHRDTDTGEHIARVATYVGHIADGLGLSAIERERMCLASTMHDIGKIAVPDDILLKPGPLSGEERRQMQQHALAGHAILEGSSSDLVRVAADIAASHHEHWDGSGYPGGLTAEAIPLAGRIVAVADVFDALTSDRPYKKAWTVEAARAYLVAKSGIQFDPACVEAFLARWPEIAAFARSTGQSGAAEANSGLGATSTTDAGHAGTRLIKAA